MAPHRRTVGKVTLDVSSLMIALVLCLCPIVAGEMPPLEHEYRFGANDVIRIQVFGEDDLTVEGKINGDGKINFPLLGAIEVGGRTVQLLRDELAAKLAEGYVRQPKVTVQIVRYRNFYVGGEVKTPGGYPYEDGLTVQKAISLAGGFTEKSDRKNITLTRAGHSIAEATPADPDRAIFPDDTIIVKHIRKFYVSGEVGKPGSYPYEDGLSVVKAISLAGGFTERSNRRAFKIARAAHTTAEADPAEPDTAVLPDDTVLVAQIKKFYVTGEVGHPGGYPYDDGLTVEKAISTAGGLTEKADRQNIKTTRIADGMRETILTTPDTPVLGDDIIVVEVQAHKFYVSGEVKTPGGYPYKDGLTVHKAIAMAGGLTEKAERGDFGLLRRTDGQEETLSVKLDTLVLPDDIVVVPEGQRFYVSGEVKTPGRYLYEKGLTVHKAISIAGGITEKGEKRDIKVTRLVNGLSKVMTADLDAAVRPDDFIVVERMQKVYVNGEVKKPGDYPYEKGITVHKAVTMAGGFTDKASEGRTRVMRIVDGQEQSIRVKLEDLILPDDIVVVPKRFF